MSSEYLNLNAIVNGAPNVAPQASVVSLQEENSVWINTDNSSTLNQEIEYKYDIFNRLELETHYSSPNKKIKEIQKGNKTNEQSI